MFCESPLYIKNPYTDSYMFVDCQHCEVCEINKANSRLVALDNYCKRWSQVLMLTLTYDNDNIPLIFNGCQGVFRGLTGKRIDIDNPVYDDEELERFYVYDSDIELSPYGLRDVDCVGVLFYRDVQLFLKRLRKSFSKDYGRKFKVVFFAVGEYGTKNRRPHYHLLFFFDKEHRQTIESFRDRCYKCWDLCNWNELDSKQTVKDVATGASQYVSAYVTSILNRESILQEKRFRQKCFRSKDISFTVDSQCEESLREYERRTTNQICPEGGRYYCQYFDKSRVDIPLVNLQSKVLFAYFRKFKAYRGLSSDAIFVRIKRILFAYLICKKRGLSVFSRETPSFNSMSYNMWLCFVRWCNCLGKAIDRLSVYEYIHSYIQFHNMYESCKLQLFMRKYEDLTTDTFDLKSYQQDCIHSFEENFSLRRARFLHKGLNPLPVLSNMMRLKLDDFKFRYKKRLLPKHMSAQREYNISVS